MDYDALLKIAALVVSTFFFAAVVMTAVVTVCRITKWSPVNLTINVFRGEE